MIVRSFRCAVISGLLLSSNGLLTSAFGSDDGGLILPEDHFPLLEQILRESAEIAPRMIEEDLQVEAARAEEQVAAAVRYPSVSGAFRYLGRLEDRADFDGTRSFYQPQGNLIARQPLYHWGALAANQRLGRLQRAVSEGNRVEAYRLLALAIRADFLDLAVRQQAIDVARERLRLAEQERTAAQTRSDRGELTGEELRVFELNAQEAALELERLRQEREFAVRAFGQLSGFQPTGDEWMPAAIPPLATGALTMEDRPDGGMLPWEEISRLRIEEAEAQLVVESARLRPRLDLVAGVLQDQVAVFDRSDIDRTVYFAGIELTWNLFDGYETQGRKAAALARKRLAVRRNQRLEREASAELDRLEQGVDWAARALALAEEHLELARQDLSQSEQDLASGLISEAELGLSRVTSRERELAATERRAEYLMAVAEFASAAGLDPAMERYWDSVGVADP